MERDKKTLREIRIAAHNMGFAKMAGGVYLEIFYI
jgi:hypothetical protein